MNAAATNDKVGPWRDAGALLAWAACGAAIFAHILGPGAALVTGLVLFALGLSHGAGEEEGGAIRPIGFPQAAAYIVAGLGVAGLFLASAAAGFALFFILSAWHFGKADDGFAGGARLAIAALAIGGSALLRPQETLDLLELAGGGSIPGPMFLALRIVGGLGAVAALAALLKNLRGCGEAAIALAACALLHPVLAVGLAFLTGHAIPVQRRQIRKFGLSAVRIAVLLPTLVAGLGLALLAALAFYGVLKLETATAIAIGLATPHMLTERMAPREGARA